MRAQDCEPRESKGAPSSSLPITHRARPSGPIWAGPPGRICSSCKSCHDFFMSQHSAIIRWTRSGPDFLKRRYSRAHTVSFDGGLTIAGSSSPHVVPLPWSDAAAVDPEEAFVASVSSCHMLWFLDV